MRVATPTRIASDAPLVTQLLREESGELLLVRRLDDPWRRDPVALDAFLLEIASNARAPRHPKLVPFRAGCEAPDPELAREYVEAGTLQDLLDADVRLSALQLLTVATDLLEGLDALHSVGIVHGDPGPRNLLLAPDGGVRLADPASARRAFAEGAVALDGGAASDATRALRWLAHAVERTAADPVGKQIAEILGSGATALMRAGELRRLAAGHPRTSLPGRPEGPPPVPPFVPLPVLVAVGPIPGERTRYLASRRLSPLAELPAPVLASRLEKEAVPIPSELPEPARALAGELSALGARVQIRRRRQARTVTPALPAPPGTAKRPGWLGKRWIAFRDPFLRLFDEATAPAAEDLREAAIQLVLLAGIAGTLQAAVPFLILLFGIGAPR